MYRFVNSTQVSQQVGSLDGWELKPEVADHETKLFITWNNWGMFKDLPMVHRAPRCYPAWTQEDLEPPFGEAPGTGWPVIDPALWHYDMLADAWLAQTVREERGLPRTLTFCAKCMMRRVR